MDYVEHKNQIKCHNIRDWDIYTNSNKNNLHYIQELDMYVDLNITSSFTLLDEHNIRTIIQNGSNISYLDTNFTYTNTPLTIEDYHKKYCYLDGNKNIWIYTRKYINSDKNIHNTSVLDNIINWFKF